MLNRPGLRFRYSLTSYHRGKAVRADDLIPLHPNHPALTLLAKRELSIQNRGQAYDKHF